MIKLKFNINNKLEKKKNNIFLSQILNPKHALNSNIQHLQ